MRRLPKLCVVLALAACGADRGPDKLAGALRDDIPLFEPSALEESEDFAFSSGSDFDDLTSYEGRTWTLSTTRPLAEVMAFYQQAVPPLPEPVPEEEEIGDEWDAMIDWGDEEEDEADEAETTDENEHGLVDLPSRVFRLASKGAVEVEVSVYLQPRQRKNWFSITQTAAVGDS